MSLRRAVRGLQRRDSTRRRHSRRRPLEEGPSPILVGDEPRILQPAQGAEYRSSRFTDPLAPSPDGPRGSALTDSIRRSSSASRLTVRWSPPLPRNSRWTPLDFARFGVLPPLGRRPLPFDLGLGCSRGSRSADDASPQTVRENQSSRPRCEAEIKSNAAIAAVELDRSRTETESGSGGMKPEIYAGSKPCESPAVHLPPILKTQV